MTAGSETRDILGPLRPRESDLVFIDGLTGLCNQRFMMDLFEEHWADLASLASPFALVMIDLDLFKVVNDRYGHLAGDEVLRVTAELLRDEFRESDLVFRYGGDEFVVLLPGVTASEAEALGERAREAMKRHEFIQPDEKAKIDVPISFSIGVAAYPADGGTGREILAAADDRLYIDKRMQLRRRQRKRILWSGLAIGVLAMAVTATLLYMVEGREHSSEAQGGVVAPATLPVLAPVESDREALLLEIAELQRQIEILRATKGQVSPEHGGEEIAALEAKIRELTEALRTSADEGEPVEIDPAPPTGPPAMAVPRVTRDEGLAPEPELTKTVNLTPPRLRDRVIPDYPPFAKERGIEASITLEILVNSAGKVVEASVRGDEIGFGFEDAARKAAFESSWHPATRNGEPVAMRTALQVRFESNR